MSALVRTITEAGFAEAAKLLSCEVAAIKAVAQVEASGQGYLDPPDNRPKILFEAHHFDRLTGGRFRASHPNLSSAKWDRKLYSGSLLGEWDRLNAASLLDEKNASKSASWGTFQIMGFNHAVCGFVDVTSFVLAMFGDADQHLAAFCRFIASNQRMLQALQRGNWATFARSYNGPEFRKNDYDGRMYRAYLRAKKIPA